MLYSEFVERTHYSKVELVGMAKGNLVQDPPEAGIPRLPLPPFLMFDRITKVERKGRSGHLIAEQDIQPDAWYFQCHFNNDPVQPGCLGLDAIWQLIGFIARSMARKVRAALWVQKEVEFMGQIRPFDKKVTYELQIRRFSVLKDSGAALAIADGTVSVDGAVIYTVKDAKVGIFRDIAYNDYPNPESRFARGGLMSHQS